MVISRIGSGITEPCHALANVAVALRICRAKVFAGRDQDWLDVAASRSTSESTAVVTGVEFREKTCGPSSRAMMAG